MEILKPPFGAVKKRKRVGRGPGTGRGKTSTRGHKGQKARKGGKVRVGFEGGQTPLIRRIPKRGFRNTKFQENYTEVNIYVLNKFDNNIVNIEEYKKHGLINSNKTKIKILGNGKIEKKVEVYAHKFTKQAQEKIEKAGGKTVIIK